MIRPPPSTTRTDTLFPYTTLFRSRSDVALADQITSPGATWLDRQLVAREPVTTGSGFGLEVRDAMEARAQHLEVQGLARRQGQRLILAQDLIGTLRNEELASTAQVIADRKSTRLNSSH